MKNLLKRAYEALPLKQQLFSGLRPLGLPHSLYKHLHFRGVIEVQTAAGKSFRINHDGFQDENELFWVGLDQCWEKESFKIWRALCKQREKLVIFDAGANNGIYSLVAQSINPTASVFAFEPVPQINEAFRNNVRLNRFPVTVEPYAVSDREGKTTLYVPPTAHSYSASLDPNFPSLSSDAIPVEVRTVTFSEYRKEKKLEQIDLLKIDVEGFEAQALRGLKDDWINYRPDLLLEVLSDDSGRAIEEILKDKGYLYFDIDEVHGPKRVPHIRKSTKYNYLVCKPETATYLGLNLDL